MPSLCGDLKEMNREVFIFCLNTHLPGVLSVSYGGSIIAGLGGQETFISRPDFSLSVSGVAPWSIACFWYLPVKQDQGGALIWGERGTDNMSDVLPSELGMCVTHTKEVIMGIFLECKWHKSRFLLHQIQLGVQGLRALTPPPISGLPPVHKF